MYYRTGETRYHSNICSRAEHSRISSAYGVGKLHSINYTRELAVDTGSLTPASQLFSTTVLNTLCTQVACHLNIYNKQSITHSCKMCKYSSASRSETHLHLLLHNIPTK